MFDAPKADYVPFSFNDAEKLLKGSPNLESSDPSVTEWLRSTENNPVDLYVKCVAIVAHVSRQAIEEYRRNPAEDPLRPPRKTLSSSKYYGFSKVALVQMAELCISTLNCLASSGSYEATYYLVKTLTDGVNALNENALINDLEVKNRYQEISKPLLQWPISYSPHSQMGTDPQALQALQLGTNTELCLLGKGSKRRKSISLKTPATKTAIRLYETLKENQMRLQKHSSAALHDSTIPNWCRKCVDLPPFSEGTAEMWLQVGWESIMEATDGKPEDHDYLREYGTHRASRGKSNTAKQTAKRDGIKESIRKALKQLAPKTAKKVTSSTSSEEYG